MGLDRWHRYSRSVTRTKRWKALRLLALRRDNFQCVECGSRHRLEVDHIESVRTNPDKAWDLGNLQVLCAKHHTAKTRLECGHDPIHPQRKAWRDLIADMPKEESRHA